MLLTLLTLLTLAAPDDKTAADLCVRALELRPTEQLQDRTTCRITKSLVLPKGPLKQAVIVNVPLASGDESALFIHDGKRWFDFGRVAGDRRVSIPGSLDGYTELWSVDAFAARMTSAGVVVTLGIRIERTTREGAGSYTIDNHFSMACRHDGSEPLCVHVTDRVDLRLDQSKGRIPDIEPESWTRTVTIDKLGQVVIGERQGTGKPTHWDVPAGTHTFAALAEIPFVRRFPLTQLVHPDATKDLELPGLP